MQRKIWVVSELYYPEETSTGYLITKIAEGLSKHYPVHILCGQPTYSSRGIKAPRLEERLGVNIRRCMSTTLNKDVFLLKLINLMTISISMFFHALILIKSRDVVLVVTNPPALPFLIMIACRLRKAKCVLIVHDVYPDTLIAAGMISRDSFPVRILNWMTKKLYGQMEYISVVGRDMDALVRRKLDSSSPGKTIIIHNWADVDQIEPESPIRNRLLDELGLVGKFVLQCAGNMGRVQGIEDLLEAAKIMSKIDKEVHFLFIGFGAKKKWLEEAVETNRLQNVTILPNRPRSDQQVFLNACDVAIMALVPGMSGVGVPSRAYNIFAAGKPIIAAVDDDSELALTVVEEKMGWIVPPNQPEKIVDAIREARANPGRLAEMGRRARAVAESKYTFQSVIDAYRRLVGGIFERAI